MLKKKERKKPALIMIEYEMRHFTLDGFLLRLRLQVWVSDNGLLVNCLRL